MLRQTFGNDIALLLAAYNAGPQAVIAAGYTVPPAAETQRYLRCVLAARDAYRQQGINTRFASIPEAQVSVDGEPDILVGSLRLSPRVARVGQRITVSLEVQYRGNTAIQGTVMLTYPEPLVSFVALRTSERRTIVRLPSSQGREALQALWGAPAYQFLQSSWSAWQPGQRRSAVLALVPRLLQDLALHLSVFVYDATETTVRYRWSTVVRIPVRSRTW